MVIHRWSLLRNGRTKFLLKHVGYIFHERLKSPGTKTFKLLLEVRKRHAFLYAEVLIRPERYELRALV